MKLLKGRFLLFVKKKKKAFLFIHLRVKWLRTDSIWRDGRHDLPNKGTRFPQDYSHSCQKGREVWTRAEDGVNHVEAGTVAKRRGNWRLLFFSRQVSLAFQQVIFRLKLLINGTSKYCLLQLILNVLIDNAGCQVWLGIQIYVRIVFIQPLNVSKFDTFLFPWNLLRNISSIDKNTGSPVFIPFGHCFKDINSHFYGLAALWTLLLPFRPSHEYRGHGRVQWQLIRWQETR